MYFSNAYIIDTEQKYSRANIQKNINLDFRANVFVSHQREFSELISTIDELEVTDIPPKSVIIIDSLSNILKSLNADCNSYPILQGFNATFLTKLISLIVKKELFCILVHHISYNPLLGEVPSYYTSIVQNLEGIWISLENNINHDQVLGHDTGKTISLSFIQTTNDAILSQFCVQFRYILQNGMFVLGDKVDD